MSALKDKNIILGITGSIAAFKCAEILRLLKEAGASVRVIMTEGAHSFITPMMVQALSGHPVYQQLMDAETEAAMSHIELARWADLVVIAPATAHCIAKLATGLADDLLTTLCLATTAPLVIAPAMNMQMWLNSATRANVKQLKARNIQVLGPTDGLQACGEIGIGRMLEPNMLLNEIALLFNNSQRLTGKNILITAGPTQEALDPVRYLSNHSSGKMGYAIAAAAAQEGAKVTLISGPTNLEAPPGVTRINVLSAQEMYEAVMIDVAKANIFIGTAAVADYRVKAVSKNKIKKTPSAMHLELVPNPDILATVSQLKSCPVTIGFAAETESLLENAREKLRQKHLDIIVANYVGTGLGFQSDDNELTIITAKEIRKLPFAPKKQLAKELIDFLIIYLQEQKRPALAPKNKKKITGRV